MEAVFPINPVPFGLREVQRPRRKVSAMIPSSFLPLALVSTVLNQLATVTTLSAQPCQNLHQDILQRLTRFFTQPLTPQATYDFEIDLRQLLDRCGQQILEAALNSIEPEQPSDTPKHAERDGYDYCRKNQKSLNRGGIATLFGIIPLQRCLYEPLQEARDDDQPAFAPLELRLGVVAANATPALAERSACWPVNIPSKRFSIS